MKKSNAVWFLSAFAVGFLIMYNLNSAPARAEGEVVCRITANTGTAATTTQGDGGALCPWTAGSVVVMQCVDAVVCYDPNSSNGGVATVAGSLCVDQTGIASDPVMIGLNPSETRISLILKAASDGGTTANCKFAATRRRIPAP